MYPYLKKFHTYHGKHGKQCQPTLVIQRQSRLSHNSLPASRLSAASLESFSCNSWSLSITLVSSLSFWIIFHIHTDSAN